MFVGTPKVICVEGLIGVGKTTFCLNLAKRIGGVPILELDGDSNKYLSRFYEKPEEYAFKMQNYLLTKRFHSHKEAAFIKNTMHKHVILDRSVYGDRCFARLVHKDGFMTFDEYEDYSELHRTMLEYTPKPDIVVFLECDIETSLARINKRMGYLENRLCESAIKKEYLQSLQRELDILKDELRYTAPIISVDCATLPEEGVVDAFLASCAVPNLNAKG